MSLFEPIFTALEQSGTRYVVVGGLATVLHGYARLTAGVDVVVDLAPVPALAAIRALASIGLVPRAPVVAEDFANERIRSEWASDKGMRVFTLWDPALPMRSVDLFIEHIIDFELLHERSEVVSLASSRVRIASIEDLIQLKGIANRPQDLTDIAALQAIRRARGRP